MGCSEAEVEEGGDDEDEGLVGILSNEMEIGRKNENLGTTEVEEIRVLESERLGRCRDCGILAENNRKEKEIAITERETSSLLLCCLIDEDWRSDRDICSPDGPWA